VGFATIGTAGRVLTDNGAGTDPTFLALPTNTLLSTGHSHVTGNPTSGSFTVFSSIVHTFAAGESAMVTATSTTTNQDLTNADALTWGIAIDSTTALTTPSEVISLGAGASASGAVCWKFVTPGAGSHTINVLARRGGTSSMFTTDTQMNVFFVTA